MRNLPTLAEPRDLMLQRVETLDAEIAEVSSGVTLRDLLRILFKRKRLILTFFIATVCTAVPALLLLSKPQYLASAQIMLTPGREHISDVGVATGGLLGPRLNFSADEQAGRTVEMLTGRFLAANLVRKFDPSVLYPELSRPQDEPIAKLTRREPLSGQALFDVAVARFMGDVGAEIARTSSLVNLTFKHRDPVIAAAVVNGLADAYLDRHLEVLSNPKTTQFLQEHFDRAKTRLEESERSLEQFKREHGITTSLKEQLVLTVNQQVSAHTALDQTISQEAELRTRIAQLRRQMESTISDPLTVNLLREKLVNLQIQERELALRFTEANPSLRAMREEMNGIRQQLTILEKDKVYGNASSKDASVYSNLQQELLKADADLKAIAARRLSQEGNVTGYQDRLELLNSLEREFDRRLQEVAQEQQNYKLYLSKLEEAKIGNAMDAEKLASVKILERAQPPLHPINEKLGLKLALVFCFALLGSLATAFGLELFNGKLQSEEDVEGYLHVPVFGSVPHFRLR